MLKFRGTSGNREFLGLVLEEGNLRRLREERPIHILKEEMDLPFDVVILYTDDITAITKKMMEAGMITPDTIIHDQRERKKS